jgi:lysophospholipase L1-like esterase
LEVPFGAVTLAVSGFQSYATVHKVTNVAEGGWTGKKWTMIGDSITDANNQRATKRYFDYISEVTGITTVNLGLSGTGYKKPYNSNLPFYQRVDTVPTDSDVITIFGSGNDCSLTLGTPTDSTSDTVCGCINLTIDGIRDRIVGANIGIITPTPWMQYPTTTANNAMDLYADAIVEICRLKGVPCLDLYHCSNMLPWVESFRTAFYKHDDGNGTHPDEDGHKLFAPRIKAFLETLLM